MVRSPSLRAPTRERCKEESFSRHKTFRSSIRLSFLHLLPEFLRSIFGQCRPILLHVYFQDAFRAVDRSQPGGAQAGQDATPPKASHRFPCQPYSQYSKASNCHRLMPGTNNPRWFCDPEKYLLPGGFSAPNKSWALLTGLSSAPGI